MEVGSLKYQEESTFDSQPLHWGWHKSATQPRAPTRKETNRHPSHWKESVAGWGTRKWLEEPRGVDIIERREFYTQMNHMIYVGRMKREYVRREVPILTLFKPLFNSPVSSLFLKSRGEKMGTGVVFPGSCHVYAFKVDVPRGQSQKKVKSYSWPFSLPGLAVL